MMFDDLCGRMSPLVSNWLFMKTWSWSLCAPQALIQASNWKPNITACVFVCFLSFEGCAVSFFHCSIFPPVFFPSLIFPPHLSGFCLISSALLPEFFPSLLPLLHFISLISSSLLPVFFLAFSLPISPLPFLVFFSVNLHHLCFICLAPPAPRSLVGLLCI